MHTRADQSANWELGLKNFMDDTTIPAEEKRKARVCGSKLAMITPTMEPTPSELDLERALKAYLLKADHKPSYINNLMSVFYRIVAASPKTPLYHEKAASWRTLICQHNENLSVIGPTAMEHIISWVTAIGLDVGPVTQDQLLQFTDFLEKRGLNPYEGGTRHRKSFRKVLVNAGLFIDTTVKHDYEISPEYEAVIKEMEILATAPHRKTMKHLDLLSENFGKTKEPIRPITWKKNRRHFIRYLKYHLANGFDGKNWNNLSVWKAVMEFTMSVHKERPMKAATAQDLVSGIISCLRLLLSLGYVKMNEAEFDQKVSGELWLRIDRFEDYFPISEKNLNLPLYEKIYRKFMEGALVDFGKIRKNQSPRMLRSLVLAIFAFEFGWRPQDLQDTIRLEHIKELETLDGQKFYFVRYQPSKTNKGVSSMYANTALPPWFNEVFDLFFAQIRETQPNEPLFPIAHMSTKVSRLSYRYFREKFSANDYRKMIGSFFSRHNMHGLYMITGRSADKDKEIVTEVELRHYVEAATSEESLLELRFGKKVRKVLEIEDLIERVRIGR